MLSSALGIVRQPYYRTLYDKAGALLRSLIKNHPYRDGNKRMGMALTTVLISVGEKWRPGFEITLTHSRKTRSRR